MLTVSSSKSPSVDNLDATRADVPYSEEVHNSQSNIPDGGTTAWMTTAGSWLVLFSTFGYVASFGVYQDYYTRTFMTNKTASAIAWIGSTQLGLVFLMSDISGKLLDMGYFHSCIRAGSLLYVFSMFMLSLAHQYEYYQVFLPQAIGLGMGQSLTFVPAVGILSHHFKNRLSLATGIVFSGASVGGILFPITLNNIIERSGFAWGVRATAFMVLGCLLAANLMMKTRLPPQTHQEHHSILSYKNIIADKAFMLTVFGVVCIELGVSFPPFYLQLFANGRNLDKNLAFYILTILNSASILGRTIPNFISDKVGVFTVMIPCCALAGALTFVMFGIHSSAALVTFALLFGFFSGSCFALMTPVIVSHAKSMHEVGARLGFAFTVAGIAVLSGPPIAGALLTDEYLWYRPVVFAGVVTLTGSGSFALSKMIQSRRVQGA